MGRPQLSWYPLRHVNSALEAGHPSLEHWFAQAYALGLQYVEISRALLPSGLPEIVRQVRKRLERHELSVSMLICSPDLTHPDPQVREEQYRDMLGAIEIARGLGAAGLRVTTGREHADVERRDAVLQCAEMLLRLAEVAQRAGVKLGLENHYRDRGWTCNDFACEAEVFLEVFDRIKDSPVGINFDTGSPLMTGDDALQLLEVVKHKVWHVHAADRFPGHHTQTVLGEGAVELDPIFRCLADIGYEGFIGLADDNPQGDRGTERGLIVLRQKVAQWWK